MKPYLLLNRCKVACLSMVLMLRASICVCKEVKPIFVCVMILLGVLLMLLAHSFFNSYALIMQAALRYLDQGLELEIVDFPAIKQIIIRDSM